MGASAIGMRVANAHDYTVRYYNRIESSQQSVESNQLTIFSLLNNII